MSRSQDPTRSIELIWLDPKRAARIRGKPAWRRILDEARSAPPEEPGDPALPNQDVPPEDRRDVLLIVARADATDGDGVSAALSESVRDDGKFAPPLVLVAGELRFPFGEIETLKATVTTATPFVPGDEALKAAVDQAKEFLAIPGLSPSPAVVEAITGRIREAWGRVKRAVPPGYLEAQTERAMLEQRRYQKRTFQGEPHLRALIQAPGDRTPQLVYLPEAVADKLPLYQRFGARLVALAHLSVDQYESHPYALEAIALARESAAPPRR
jgi:hypothetical protein